MNYAHQLCFCALWLSCAWLRAADAANSSVELPPPATNLVSFARDVRPIFESSCVNCHGKGRDKGGFQLDTRETLLKGGDSGPAVVEGKSAESLLIKLVAGVDPDNVMPRKGKRLTAEQIGILRAWIDQGIGWEAAFTFAKPAPRNLMPRTPELLADKLHGHPVDRIVAKYFDEHKLTQPDVVDDRTFARRVYLDVVGLLPSPSELQAFQEDTSANKREKLVRTVLQDNQGYAEHWLSFWNDLLRNDYRGTGYIDGGRKQITGWLYSALATNMPYDRFVAQLINPTPASEGFVKGIVWRGVVNASQSPEMQAAQNISQVFMGVNLKCASCHDSFINDWRLSDAYGLAAIYSDKPLEMFLCDKPTGKIVNSGFIYPQLGQIDPNADKKARIARLSEIITCKADGRLTRTLVNRLWAKFFGRGLVEPLDDMEQPAWNADLLDCLAEDFAQGGYDTKLLIERILTSAAYQLPAVDLSETPDKNYVFKGPAIRRLSAEQFRDAVGQLTGIWPDKPDFKGGETNRPVRASLVAADPLSTALGRPNREQVITARATAATTLQGLELTNGKTLTEVLDQGATKLVERQVPANELVQEIYTTALGRRASPQEQDTAVEFVGAPATKDGVRGLLWAVTMLPEFQLIY